MKSVRLFLRPFGDTRQNALFETGPTVGKMPVSLHARSESSPPGGFEIVDNIQKADFVVIPHSVRRVSPILKGHIEETIALAAQYHKEVIVFVRGDLSHDVHIENVIVFKPSIYKHDKRAKEVIFASLARDLSLETPIALRHKSGKPSVSFCGYAGFPFLKTRLKYLAKNAWLDFTSVILQQPELRAYKRGIYFRRASLAQLASDSRIDTRFIIRRAFFHQAGLDPIHMRQEYLKNMSDADFVLCPKGDGNYSMRFYEALSLGKIPILIDTDMILPFEHIIDYSQCIVRVHHTRLHSLPDILVEFYNSISDEAFVDMQQNARRIYLEYLRYDVYFGRALQFLKEKGPEAL